VRYAVHVANTAASETRTKFWWEELNTIDNLVGRLDCRIIFKRFLEKQGVKLSDLIQLPTALDMVVNLLI
jgi:hypothetical protein